jgi:hypothetical protein
MRQTYIEMEATELILVLGVRVSSAIIVFYRYIASSSLSVLRLSDDYFEFPGSCYALRKKG